MQTIAVVHNKPYQDTLAKELPDLGDILSATGPDPIYQDPVTGSPSQIADFKMRHSHVLAKNINPGVTGTVTLYERPVSSGPAPLINAQHTYLVVNTSDGQSFTIEAGPSSDNNPLGSEVVLRGDYNDTQSNATWGVSVNAPSGESFSDFVNGLISSANHFDMTNTETYGGDTGVTSNSNSFVAGLLDYNHATFNSQQLPGTQPGFGQPFAPADFGP